MKITHEQFITLIQERKGAVALGIESRTDSRARKTGNPYGLIFKRARTSGLTGVSYENAINRRIDIQRPITGSHFTSEALWGGKGEYVVPNKVARHTVTGKLYLSVQASDRQYDAFPARVQYENEQGQPLDAANVRPFLPERAVSAKQADHGLDHNQQNIRLYSLDNITAIHLDGQTYELVKE